jgi:hypothetical protein
MRVNGHNVFAIIVAAIAIYAIEFLIFGLAIAPDQFMQMSGMNEAQRDAGMGRMPFGIVMPVLAAIGLSLVIKWRGASGALAGAATAAIVAVCLAFAGRMYGFVYGPHTEIYLAIDLARFAVTYAIAGAILAAWK